MLQLVDFLTRRLNRGKERLVFKFGLSVPPVLLVIRLSMSDVLLGFGQLMSAAVLHWTYHLLSRGPLL